MTSHDWSKAFGLALIVGLVTHAAPAAAETSDFGLHVSASGAIENAGFSGAIGGRYRLTSEWLIGVDAEINPWIGGRIDDVRPGVLNLYATVVKRFPMSYEALDLRTTAEVGVSRILFDLVGVAGGSVGPYFGFNLLGLDYELSDDFYLIFDPAHISIPIPQVTGVPFAYIQYQVRVGLQIGG